RHTRSDRDWSSDVCSSDLARIPSAVSPSREGTGERRNLGHPTTGRAPFATTSTCGQYPGGQTYGWSCRNGGPSCRTMSSWFVRRSEERRVGKEGRAQG